MVQSGCLEPVSDPKHAGIYLDFGMGLAATIGHVFIVWAMGNAPANVLAPFQYVEMLGRHPLATWCSMMCPPDTMLGVTIIVLSGVYLFHRERQVSLTRANSGTDDRQPVSTTPSQ